MDPSRAHALAIADLTDAAVEYKMYRDGKVTDPDSALTYPYLIQWPGRGPRTLDRLAGAGHSMTTTTQITAVGRDIDEVLAALDRVSAALTGVTPHITGRNCSRIADISPPDQVPEKSDVTQTPEGQPVYRAFGLYRLMSTPA